jgi:hypothetical protein
MNKLEVHQQVLRDTVRDDMSTVDVVWHMVVLHTHSIALPRGIGLEDVFERDASEERVILAPLTKSHLSSLAASLWPNDAERSRASFWSMEYSSMAYEVFADIPEGLRDRAEAAKRHIESHYLVDQLIAE